MTASEMQQQEYINLDAVDERMFYFRALHERLLLCLDRFAPRDAAVLDAGCGTGGFLRRLQTTRPALRLTGADLSALACELAAEKTGLPIHQASIEELPFADEAFDVVVAADVLSMLADPRPAVHELGRCLRLHGTLVVTLPAYEWLKSYHDQATGNVRRFTRRGLDVLLARNGLDVLYSTYWNTLLFPLAVARRKLMRGDGASDVKPHHPVLDAAFGRVLELEAALIRRGAELPFGLSMLAVARRR